MRPSLAYARRIVVKIGSSLLTNDGKGLDRSAIDDWCAQMVSLTRGGRQILLVSSGAIAAGMERLGFTQRPSFVNELQACAAVGQMGLAQQYEQSFGALEVTTAQVLLTHGDLMERERYLNARSTLQSLLAWGVVPVINENDTVVNDEIKFGDNDTLGALVANLVEADVLIILTDQAGLYDADPRSNPNAQLVSEARAGDSCLVAMAGGAGSNVGRGGMATKVTAAARAARSGAHTVIVGGRQKDVLLRVLNDENLGSLLYSQAAPISARKQWVADHLHTQGAVEIDAGAQNKLKTEGKSLLPVGVRAVYGDFGRGAVIRCIDAQGQVIAHGLSNYSSADIQKILGHSLSEVSTILGYANAPELIHRDNLVLL